MATHLVKFRRARTVGMALFAFCAYCSAPAFDAAADRNSEENAVLNYLLSLDRGPRISTNNLSFREGGSSQYILSMDRSPGGEAHVDISFDVSQVTVNGSSVSPARVTFTASNWRTPRTISLFALDDSAIGGTRTVVLSHALSGVVEGLSVPGNVSLTIGDNELRIYLTAATTMGRIEVDGIAGIAGADLFCMRDANYPGSGTYKAMLADGTNRRACMTANCASTGAAENIDWVLQANTSYHRVDGTLIASIGNGVPVFTPPLTNPLTAANVGAWTGIESSWETIASTDTCTGFTSSAISPNRGIMGRANGTGTDFMNGTTDQGNAAGHVYCVEQ